MDTFRKVQVNIPLLDAIKQIPKYAKFLKEWCMNKKKSKGMEKVDLTQNVSAVFQKDLPPKCSDPGMFTIPCIVGNVTVNKAMLDLGASINVMSYSLYTSLDMGPLKPTNVLVQLANKSIVYPRGVLEDVLVKVNELIFPADFYVIDMEENNTSKSNMMLLGRPFLKTARTKIDVYSGTLTMEFGNEVVKFNIHDTMRYLRDVHSLCFVNASTPLTNNVSALTNDFVLKEKSSRNEKVESLKKLRKAPGLNDETLERIPRLEMGQRRYEDPYYQVSYTNAKPLSIFLQEPKVGLKSLPDLLKHEHWSSGGAIKIEEVSPGWMNTGFEMEVPWSGWDAG